MHRPGILEHHASILRDVAAVLEEKGYPCYAQRLRLEHSQIVTAGSGNVIRQAREQFYLLRRCTARCQDLTDLNGLVTMICQRRITPSWNLPIRH